MSHRIAKSHAKHPSKPVKRVEQPAAPPAKAPEAPGAIAQDSFKRSPDAPAPQPAPQAAPQPSPSAIPPGMPFGNSARLGEALSKSPDNPITQAGVAIAAPIALAADVLNVLAGPPVQHAESTTTVKRGRFEITTHTTITITRGKP